MTLTIAWQVARFAAMADGTGTFCYLTSGVCGTACLATVSKWFSDDPWFAGRHLRGS